MLGAWRAQGSPWAAETQRAFLLLKLLALGWRKEQPGMPPSTGSIPGSSAAGSHHTAGPWAWVSPCAKAGHTAGGRGGRARAGGGGSRDLGLLPESNSDVAADLGESLKERVAEGVDAEGVDSADALDLNQVALDAGHHCPDVAEGDEGKEEAPDDCQGDAQDGREQPVAPVLADGEGGVAGFPDAVKAVCSHRLSYHILKIHLGGRRRV